MRRIICEPCAASRAPGLHPAGLHPEDAAAGFQKRMVRLRVKKPAELYMDIETAGGGHMNIERYHVPCVLCDICGQELPDGSTAVAVSMWRGGGLACWEREYGEVLT